MDGEECAKLIEERVKDVAHLANQRIAELTGALNILAIYAEAHPRYGGMEYSRIVEDAIHQAIEAKVQNRKKSE